MYDDTPEPHVMQRVDLHGYPLNLLPEFAQSYFAKNIRLLHVRPESVTVSLIFLYVACCWFVSDAKPLHSTRMGSMLASHTDRTGLAATVSGFNSSDRCWASKTTTSSCTVS
jgi:hypothetical protein